MWLWVLQVRAVESLVELIALGQSSQLAVEPLLVASIVDQIQKQQTLEVVFSHYAHSDPSCKIVFVCFSCASRTGQ